MNSKIPRILGMFFLLLIPLGMGWVWLTLHWSYSEGERAGYVQKLSKKGWLCKTWEGEIAMVTMPGAIPEKFVFTVRDDDMANKINNLAGERVILHYQQHKFIPSTCFGETEYFVSDVRGVQVEKSALPAPSVPQGQLQAPR
jgi:phosphotransferase system  glucose/maltose/N-acetylglucosamine-specific IIC component